METITIPAIMNETSRRHLFKGMAVGFVPTMGALHDGHLNLVRRARQENDIVVVSIFVNPIQFAQNEDFDKYPKDMEMDMKKLQKEGVDILFTPDGKSMYPDNFSTYITVRGLSDKLCGAFRSEHFTGVTTVVCKLFNIVMPRRVYFGQKDFQQTTIIKRLIVDLNMNIELTVCPTVRENDGLAVSSRNVYLNPEEKMVASVIYRTLQPASQLIKSSTSTPLRVKNFMNDMLISEPLISEIQYAGVYDPDTLDELSKFNKQNLIAIALKIGSTRLIDNMLVEIP